MHLENVTSKVVAISSRPKCVKAEVRNRSWTKYNGSLFWLRYVDIFQYKAQFIDFEHFA